MKSVRSSASSPASSPSRSLRLMSIGSSPLRPASATSRVDGAPSPGRAHLLLASRVVLEIGSHALAQEHRMMALEDPLAGPVAEGPRGLVPFQLVDRRVIGQLEQDHVVEV